LIARNGGGYYRSTLLDALPWLEHGFGTRREAMASVHPLAQLRQIHSAHTVDAGSHPGVLGEADGLVTGEAGLFLGVKTADCLPLLLVDPEARAIAAVHAGWRGTVARIARRAVEHLERRFGSKPHRLLAAIGPGIGPCCFEVGPEVAGQFRDLFPDRADLDRRTRLDLVEANLRILEEAGVPRAQVDAGRLCTCCQPTEFHSYRRDGPRAGRMFSVIAIKNTKGAGAIPAPSPVA
jgi:YfiH family protein